MTCEHLTDDYGAALLTWYREDSRVKTSVLPETVLESRAKNRPSGSRCSESFGRFDRNMSLWKTPPDLFGTDSTLSSKAWTRAGTMRNGVCWARPTLARHTIGNAAGFWHTPTVVQCARSEAAWEKRQKARHATGRKTIPPGSLEEQVRMSGKIPCWDWNISPMNSRNEATKKMFPTLRTGGMCGGSGSYQKLKDLMGKGVITPAERRSMVAGNGGKLNPEWTEWLMGFPIGWSGLEGLAMPKSRSVLQLHGTFCMNESMENNKNQFEGDQS